MTPAEVWWLRLKPGERELWTEEALVAFPPGDTPELPQAAFELYCSRGRPLEQVRIDALTAGHCPYCRYRGFVIGPMGTGMTNIECGNVNCRERFNVLFWSGTALFAHELPNGMTSEPWPSEPPPP